MLALIFCSLSSHSYYYYYYNIQSKCVVLNNKPLLAVTVYNECYIISIIMHTIISFLRINWRKLFIFQRNSVGLNERGHCCGRASAFVRNGQRSFAINGSRQEHNGGEPLDVEAIGDRVAVSVKGSHNHLGALLVILLSQLFVLGLQRFAVACPTKIYITIQYK